MDPGVGKLVDRTHMIEMCVAEDDVRNGVRRDAEFVQHAQRRNPERHAEFLAHRLAAAFLHEAGIDEGDMRAMARQHEGKGHIDAAFVIGIVDEPGNELIL